MDMTKECKDCSREQGKTVMLPLDEFYIDRSVKCGRGAYCKRHARARDTSSRAARNIMRKPINMAWREDKFYTGPRGKIIKRVRSKSLGW